MIFRDKKNLVVLDQHLDWDRSSLQSISISGYLVQFVVEVPLLTFHDKYEHDSAYVDKMQFVTAAIKFLNVNWIKTTNFEMETVKTEGKRDFEELWNVYRKDGTYIVIGPNFEFHIDCDKFEFELSEMFAVNWLNPKGPT